MARNSLCQIPEGFEPEPVMFPPTNVPTVFVDRRITIRSRPCGGHEGYFLGIASRVSPFLGRRDLFAMPFVEFRGRFRAWLSWFSFARLLV